MDKLALFRAPQLPSPEPEPAPFAPKDESFTRRSDYIEAAAQLQRDLDASAAPDIERDPYLALPPAVRSQYNRAEYMWLSDNEKATLVQRECEPDC